MTRPPSLQPSLGSTAQLEQRLGAAQLELRKLGSERHTLRSRLRREADRLLELESALRAEKELRRQASEEYQTAMAGLRERLSLLEAETQAERARLNAELSEARSQANVATSASAPPASGAGKPLQGLRRIRGIGPAYQRALEALGITQVEQIAAWDAADVAAFADKLKIKPERITKDDWVGQAQRLGSELDGR